LIVEDSPDELSVFEITKTDFFGKNPKTYLAYNHSESAMTYLDTDIPSGESRLIRVN
jgi:hypothetical protein